MSERDGPWAWKDEGEKGQVRGQLETDPLDGPTTQQTATATADNERSSRQKKRAWRVFLRGFVWAVVCGGLAVSNLFGSVVLSVSFLSSPRGFGSALQVRTLLCTFPHGLLE